MKPGTDLPDFQAECPCFRCAIERHQRRIEQRNQAVLMIGVVVLIAALLLSVLGI